ncbi:NAD(P)/FAD-dependent oxidoreductase [Agriterribacter sp.]|uniref:NAD(P)/FAD-dependent oxidoreductase n=1 Tax=Agriterribacter sp. TaxID=2821509 RepID=UPI002B942F29|nr:NAD(P)/FAD-dependent oxidoreductase [Agriterribacter sp.]HRP54540.1 NAD(P)/FAD-dependent oxidoreductase [Agriterribacter sp.]
MKPKNTNRKHIVLIGGGFAGLSFARHLLNNKCYDVTLVDRNNYNYFTPLLYQVATGFLEPSAISYPFRKIFKGSNIAFRMAAVLKIDTGKNVLYLSDEGELSYDLLVFAAGSKTNFFGNDVIEQNAFYIKTIDDALSMRNGLIRTMEKASVEKDPLTRKKLLTMVIAGGGPTGVELAGMLAEFKQCLLGMDYPELKNDVLQVYLIEGSPHLLAPMSDASHKEACEVLKRSGIKIKLNTQVDHYDHDQVHLSTGKVIEAKTLIWAVGVTANTFEGIDESSLDKSGRMITNFYNQVKGYGNIYAIGDISIQYNYRHYPRGHPQLAQPAIQQGKRLAKNLLLLARGKDMKPFKYFDRGDMAIIGRKWAVADLFNHHLHLGGILGLLGWLFIHLISLVNYNNKIKTFYNWLIAYLTHDQALRMIFSSGNREAGYGKKQSEPHQVRVQDMV